MSAQDKKRLPDIVDKLREIDIAKDFLNENYGKFKTIVEFAEDKVNHHNDDIIAIFSAMAEALKLENKTKGYFQLGYVIGYEYGKYRTEKLNALNRNNIQK